MTGLLRAEQVTAGRRGCLLPAWVLSFPKSPSQPVVFHCSCYYSCSSLSSLSQTSLMGAHPRPCWVPPVRQPKPGGGCSPRRPYWAWGWGTEEPAIWAHWPSPWLGLRHRKGSTRGDHTTGIDTQRPNYWNYTQPIKELCLLCLRK